jgi:hypothetical protein
MPQNITLFRIEPGLNVKKGINSFCQKELIYSVTTFIIPTLKASQMKRIKIALTFQINFLPIACPLT